MEQINRPGGLETPPQSVEGGPYQRDSYVESFVTDAALDELKRQSADGCLLCSLDDLDGEEWE